MHSITYDEIISSARIIDLNTGEILQTPENYYGLDNISISARRKKKTGKAEIMQAGVRITLNRQERKNHNGDIAVRGKIKGFSKKSKNRLMRKMMKMDWQDISQSKNSLMVQSVFITLTYPSDYSQDWQDWKSHLRSFGERFRRQYGDLNGLWKLEFQERGAPHFHVMMILPAKTNLHFLRVWISRNWFEVVGSGDEKHLKAGTNTRAIYGSAQKLMNYLSKYMGKTFSQKTETGRVWGVWGDLPEAPVIVVNFDFVEFLRRIRKWGKKSPYLKNLAHSDGALIYADQIQIIKLLDGLISD